jgi:hypothetical protein
MVSADRLTGRNTQIDPSEMETRLKEHDELLENEKVLAAWQTARIYVFTNLRILIIDIQGLFNKTQITKSLFYEKITYLTKTRPGKYDLGGSLVIHIGQLTFPIDFRKDSSILALAEKIILQEM